MAAYGLGASLAGAAQQQQAEATGLLAQAAKQETQRDMTNQSLRAQAKAGNAQLGSALGTMGAVALGAGPWGIALGALAGGVAGGLF